MGADAVRKLPISSLPIKVGGVTEGSVGFHSLNIYYAPLVTPESPLVYTSGGVELMWKCIFLELL